MGTNFNVTSFPVSPNSGYEFFTGIDVSVSIISKPNTKVADVLSNDGFAIAGVLNNIIIDGNIAYRQDFSNYDRDTMVYKGEIAIEKFNVIYIVTYEIRNVDSRSHINIFNQTVESFEFIE